MCEPTTIALAVAAVAAAGSAYVSYDTQNKNAEYQNELNAYNNEMSRRTMIANRDSLAYNQNSARDSATEQLWQDDLDARKAEARARVAAGESGIAGNTVDSIMREIKGQQAMLANEVNMNLKTGQVEAESQNRQIWNNYLSEVGNRTPGQRASDAGLAFNVLGIAANSYGSYKTQQNRTNTAAKTKANGG